MKKLFILLLGLLIFSSCGNVNKKDYIIGNWERTIINTNVETDDTLFYHTSHTNFTDSGFVIYDKYNTEKYYVNSDSIFISYNFMMDDEWISGESVFYINIINDSLFSVNKDICSLDTILKYKEELSVNENHSWEEKEEIWEKRRKIHETNPEYLYDTIINYISKKCVFYKRTSELNKEVYDKIFINLGYLNSKEIPISINIDDDKTKLGDGSVMFNFRIYGNTYFIEPKIKGSVDRTLGVLPKNETIGKYSRWERSLMNKYEWETLDMKVLMENYYKTDYDDEDYLDVKIWITIK